MIPPLRRRCHRWLMRQSNGSRQAGFCRSGLFPSSTTVFNAPTERPASIHQRNDHLPTPTERPPSTCQRKDLLPTPTKRPPSYTNETTIFLRQRNDHFPTPTKRPSSCDNGTTIFLRQRNGHLPTPTERQSFYANGVTPSSPGLPRSGYPGTVAFEQTHNPERVAPLAVEGAATPLGLKLCRSPQSQGSDVVATLGWKA